MTRAMGPVAKGWSTPLKKGPGKSGIFIKARRRVPAPKGRRSSEGQHPCHPPRALGRAFARLAIRRLIRDDRGEGG